MVLVYVVQQEYTRHKHNCIMIYYVPLHVVVSVWQYVHGDAPQRFKMPLNMSSCLTRMSLSTARYVIISRWYVIMPSQNVTAHLSMSPLPLSVSRHATQNVTITPQCLASCHSECHHYPSVSRVMPLRMSSLPLSISPCPS